MRDGLYYAAKTFTPPFKASASDQKRKRDEEKWRDIIQNEIDIMRNNAHVSVPLPLPRSAPVIALIIE